MARTDRGYIQGRILSTLFFLLILLNPILRYYNLGSSGIGMENLMSILALLTGVILIYTRLPVRTLNRGPLIKSRRRFLVFGVWALIITFIYEFFTEINIHNPLANYSNNLFIVMAINIVLIYIIISAKYEVTQLFRIYSVIVWFLLGLILFQWLLFLTGRSMSFKIPFMQYTSGWSSLQNKNFGMSPYPRALFSEKSHFAQYILPYVAICLYSEKIVPKRRILKAIIASIAILTTVSGNGIIVLLVEWLLYFIALSNMSPRNKMLFGTAGIALLFLVYILLQNFESFSLMFDTLFSSENNRASKADYRIYRGLDMFRQLPIVAQLLGIGNSHMYMYASMHGISSIYDVRWSVYEYFSAIFEIAIYYGLTGLVLCGLHLKEILFAKTKVTTGLIIMMLALWISTEMIFRNYHLFYMLLIVGSYAFENQGDNLS